MVTGESPRLPGAPELIIKVTFPPGLPLVPEQLSPRVTTIGDDNVTNSAGRLPADIKLRADSRKRKSGGESTSSPSQRGKPERRRQGDSEVGFWTGGGGASGGTRFTKERTWRSRRGWRWWAELCPFPPTNGHLRSLFRSYGCNLGMQLSCN